MLEFKDITLASIHEIRPYLFRQNYRTCDYTIGGIMMWAAYFNYKYCIKNDSLFIMGKDPAESSPTTFAMPIGCPCHVKALNLLWEHCQENRIPLVFSVIPEDALPFIKSVFQCTETKLEDWSDYLYNYVDLSTLKGHRYNKKRNHVNKFIKTYPNYRYERIHPGNLDAVKAYFTLYQSQVSKDSALFSNEEKMVREVLDHYLELGFTGGCLWVDDQIVAFSIGEVINDTLFVHIEKASREYSGVYETINMLFARDMDHESILFINREEDVGDEGLRASKNSYLPVSLLGKYNVEVQGLGL